MTELPVPPAKRRRGAQPGNSNAHRHGFYSLKPEIHQRFETDLIGEGDDEIQMLRSIMDTTFRVFSGLPDPTLEECQSTLRAVSHAADGIRGLSLMKKVLHGGSSTMEQIIDQLKNLPPEED